MRIPMLVFLLCACLGSLGVEAGHAWGAEYKRQTIMVATANPDGGIHAKVLQHFKSIIEKESQGKISVKLFLGGSLGDEQANVRQLKTEELHVAYLGVGNLTPFAPQAALIMLPYMFPSLEHAYRLLDNKPFMQKFNTKISEECLGLPLAWVVGGYRVLTNSKKPVTRIEDLQGLKIRVPPVAIQLDAFRAWGVEPHPLAWTETFNGLQQKVVDGQENPNVVFRDQKFYEVQKYVTNIHYNIGIWPLLVSSKWFNRLDPATRELVTRAAHEAGAYGNKLGVQLENEAIDECKRQGMEYTDLQDEQKWIDRARAVWPNYYKVVGGKEMVDAALAASESVGGANVTQNQK